MQGNIYFHDCQKFKIGANTLVCFPEAPYSRPAELLKHKGQWLHGFQEITYVILSLDFDLNL